MVIMHFVLVSMFNFIRTFCNKPHFLNALELEGYVLDSVPQYVEAIGERKGKRLDCTLHWPIFVVDSR